MIVSDADPTVELLIELGFTPSPAFGEVQPREPGATTGSLSPERLDLLDADVLFQRCGSPDAEAALGANPLFQQLDVVQREANFVFVYEVWTALRSPSVLAVPYLLEEVVPRLAEVNLGT